MLGDTLEDRLEKTAELVVDAGANIPPDMKKHANRINDKLTEYHYICATREQELNQMAQKFLDQWGEWERDSA